MKTTQVHSGQKIDKEATPERGVTDLWHRLLQRTTALRKGSAEIRVLLVVG